MAFCAYEADYCATLLVRVAAERRCVDAVFDALGAWGAEDSRRLYELCTWTLRGA